MVTVENAFRIYLFFKTGIVSGIRTTNISLNAIVTCQCFYIEMNVCPHTSCEDVQNENAKRTGNIHFNFYGFHFIRNLGSSEL